MIQQVVYLVSGSRLSLPEVTLGGGVATRVASIRSLGVVCVARTLLVQASGEAGEENNEGGKEQTDHCSKNGPHANRVMGLASATVLVDLVLDDAEEGEIDSHDDHGHNPGNRRDHGGQQSAKDTGAESEEEGDEGKTAGDWVENHHASERLSTVS